METDKLNLNDKSSMFLEKDIKLVLQDLYDQFRSVKMDNEYLREENKRLKDEQYKDNELQKMKEEYDRMKEDYYRGFPISEEEEKRIQEWKDSLPKYDNMKIGAIGGRYHYEFHPTSIGVSAVIVDTITGERFEFQELG